MLKDTWQEIGKLENLFLEIVEDPTKKEVLLYPICYCQLVRKESSFDIELSKLISCASKTFHTFKGKWQDILLELHLFQFTTPSGEVLYGKDILKVSSPEGLSVSFMPEYREVFYEVYSRLLKYWTVLSKVSSYSKRNTPAEAVHMNALIFNEELFMESSLYAEQQSLRFKEEEVFFRAIRKVSDFYVKALEQGEVKPELVKDALCELKSLKGIYYGLNILRLRKDLESLLKDISRGKGYPVIKISFVLGSGHGKGLLHRIFSKVVRKLREIGGRRWTLMNSGTDCCSFTGTYWIRRRELQTLA